MNAKRITFFILFALLVIFAIATYPLIHHLQKQNTQLQKQNEQLQDKNQKLQSQVKEQQAKIETLTTAQNKGNAEETAIRFLQTLHSASSTDEQRAKELKKMMVPGLYEKKLSTNSSEEESKKPVDPIDVKLKINQVIPAKVGNRVQVNINYDRQVSVAKKENFTERINAVVTLTPDGTKWKIADFNFTYLQGPEGDI